VYGVATGRARRAEPTEREGGLNLNPIRLFNSQPPRLHSTTPPPLPPLSDSTRAPAHAAAPLHRLRHRRRAGGRTVLSISARAAGDARTTRGAASPVGESDPSWIGGFPGQVSIAARFLPDLVGRRGWRCRRSGRRGVPRGTVPACAWIGLKWIGLGWLGPAPDFQSIRVPFVIVLGGSCSFFSLRRKIIRLRCVCDLILRRPTVLAALDYYCFGISVVTLAGNQRLYGLRMVFLGSGHDSILCDMLFSFQLCLENPFDSSGSITISIFCNACFVPCTLLRPLGMGFTRHKFYKPTS